MSRIKFFPTFLFVDPNSMYVSWVFRMQTYAKNAHKRETNTKKQKNKYKKNLDERGKVTHTKLQTVKLARAHTPITKSTTTKITGNNN